MSDLTSSPIRFAILGYGLHATRRLIPAFTGSRATVLAGIWRRDPAAAEATCREHNIPINFASREELCASSEIDAVLVASPDALHCEDTLLAISHGKAVLCEKPVAMNSAEALRMAEAAEDANVLYGVAQNFRFNQTVHLFRDWIAEGRIGSPQLAHLQFTYPAQGSRRKWIADPTVACGGPIADVGVHCIDALRFILGANVHSVSTFAAQDELSGEVEAGATLQIEMTSGLLANITVSARAPYRTLLEVNGSGGVLVAENGLTVDRPVEVQRRNAGDPVETVTLSNAHAYSEMLDAFAESLCTGKPFAATGRDAVHNMLAIDAAYVSWHSGKREYITGS